MNQVKILTINKERIIFLTQLALLAGVATIAPLFNQQAITGPLVNATLFVSTALLGVQAGVLVGLIPSLIALSVGLLPPVLAPMVPFIMTSNTILVMVFSLLNPIRNNVSNGVKEKNYWLGVVAASVLKFVFLFSTSSIVINLLLKKEIASKVAIMMNWPQLFTALFGGILAYLFLRGIKKQ